ncbi:MAG TPA: amino acid ABC transporter ATP-binding protein [Candidatus Ligilactobacillus excrementavium]|nr:amino acid ABC transporter ATP-binding protein [Candidatus Ligilactobacillus excrementavium]
MLELKNITKKFGERTILDNLNLEIPDGQILAIVGPSGAGKTTLLRCLSGLETPEQGSFLLNGQPFDPTDPTNAEQIIGVVFQDYQLFPNLTVLQNITLAPKLVLKQTEKVAEKQAERLLQQLDLAGKEQLYPYQLSGGQQQRVAIVRALAMEPQVLCYDEPTSALDPALREKVGQIILSLKNEKMTQVIVTHDMDFAKQTADKVFTVNALDALGGDAV